MLIAGSYLTSHVLHAILHAHKPLVIRCSLGRNFFHSLKRCSLGISYSVTQCFCKHPSVIYVTWPVMTNCDLQALNRRENSGHFNLKAQFPFNREVLYKPDFKNKKNWTTCYSWHGHESWRYCLPYIPLEGTYWSDKFEGIIIGNGTGLCSSAITDLVLYFIYRTHFITTL